MSDQENADRGDDPARRDANPPDRGATSDGGNPRQPSDDADVPAQDPVPGHTDEPAHEGVDAGPRPGEHPQVRRSGMSRATIIGLVVALALAALLYAAIALGIAFGD